MPFFYIEVNFRLSHLICFVLFLPKSAIMKAFYLVLLIESEEWSLKRVYALRSSSKPTHTNPENKSAVTYIIHIRRKSFYYFVYLIAPCMMMSFMTLILFTLPPESGERMVVGVTILLSLIVFYLLASTHIPETSEVVPLILR